MATFIDPFHRQLYESLQAKLEHRITQLAAGSASSIAGDAASLAEKYAAQVSYIKALQDVIEECASLEAVMYGGGDKSEQQEQT
jgi:hypothetical protein